MYAKLDLQTTIRGRPLESSSVAQKRYKSFKISCLLLEALPTILLRSGLCLSIASSLASLSSVFLPIYIILVLDCLQSLTFVQKTLGVPTPVLNSDIQLTKNCFGGRRCCKYCCCYHFKTLHKNKPSDNQITGKQKVQLIRNRYFGNNVVCYSLSSSGVLGVGNSSGGTMVWTEAPQPPDPPSSLLLSTSPCCSSSSSSSSSPSTPEGSDSASTTPTILLTPTTPSTPPIAVAIRRSLVKVEVPHGEANESNETTEDYPDTSAMYPHIYNERNGYLHSDRGFSIGYESNIILPASPSSTVSSPSSSAASSPISPRFFNPYLPLHYSESDSLQSKRRSLSSWSSGSSSSGSPPSTPEECIVDVDWPQSKSAVKNLPAIQSTSIKTNAKTFQKSCQLQAICSPNYSNNSYITSPSSIARKFDQNLKKKSNSVHCQVHEENTLRSPVLMQNHNSSATLLETSASSDECLPEFEDSSPKGWKEKELDGPDNRFSVEQNAKYKSTDSKIYSSNEISTMKRHDESQPVKEKLDCANYCEKNNSSNVMYDSGTASIIDSSTVEEDADSVQSEMDEIEKLSPNTIDDVGTDPLTKISSMNDNDESESTKTDSGNVNHIQEDSFISMLDHGTDSMIDMSTMKDEDQNRSVKTELEKTNSFEEDLSNTMYDSGIASMIEMSTMREDEYLSEDENTSHFLETSPFQDFNTETKEAVFEDEALDTPTNISNVEDKFSISKNVELSNEENRNEKHCEVISRSEKYFAGDGGIISTSLLTNECEKPPLKNHENLLPYPIKGLLTHCTIPEGLWESPNYNQFIMREIVASPEFPDTFQKGTEFKNDANLEQSVSDMKKLSCVMKINNALQDEHLLLQVLQEQKIFEKAVKTEYDDKKSKYSWEKKEYLLQDARRLAEELNKQMKKFKHQYPKKQDMIVMLPAKNWDLQQLQNIRKKRLNSLTDRMKRIRMVKQSINKGLAKWRETKMKEFRIESQRIDRDHRISLCKRRRCDDVIEFMEETIAKKQSKFQEIHEEEFSQWRGKLDELYVNEFYKLKEDYIGIYEEEFDLWVEELWDRTVQWKEECLKAVKLEQEKNVDDFWNQTAKQFQKEKNKVKLETEERKIILGDDGGNCKFVEKKEKLIESVYPSIIEIIEENDCQEIEKCPKSVQKAQKVLQKTEKGEGMNCFLTNSLQTVLPPSKVRRHNPVALCPSNSSQADEKKMNPSQQSMSGKIDSKVETLLSLTCTEESGDPHLFANLCMLWPDIIARYFCDDGQIQSFCL